ncbi:hypothetical protein VTN77DRAFT_4846 [Rasamsonia byssochlamydoides]|uniref:uncharacterized protein n=1 Tax=Rasamsonia byssochlamydoides TaxID=89139 RepID=UPI0037440B68
MDSATTNGSSRSKTEDDLPASSVPKESNPAEQDEYARSRHGKFRFKSSKTRLKRDGSPSSFSHRHSDRDDQHRHSHRRHRHHHHGHHHHRSTKRRKTESSPPSPPSLHNPPLSPNTAFRESLFDALADDEGAAFWESVYGQPIHTYAVPSVPKGPDGELERMTDEEYAEYVRARMWERTHEGMMEERERLRREKTKEKMRAENERRRAEERLAFERAMEESLRRGQERRRAKAWEAAWEEYQRSWEELNAAVAAKEAAAATDAATGPENENKKPFLIRNHLFWPVESGKRRDISREAVAEFMRHAPAAAAAAAAAAASASVDIVATLKTERVRWHPDKMLHRYGSLGLSNEPALIRSVTEVFQILDQLWIEEREKAGRQKT